MPRQNIRHTPQSLRELARILGEAKVELELLASSMAANRIPTISLAHQVTVENGVMAARKMAREGISKIEDQVGILPPRNIDEPKQRN